MRLLYLTFYFEPDLCAGSFRNTPLAYELQKRVSTNDSIHVITTLPNRYKSFKEDAPDRERMDNLLIERIQLPEHSGGFFDQINAFKTFFLKALEMSRDNKYDVVFASSSRLFTAFLGRYLANRNHAKLILDIRDIFTDTMKEVLDNRFIKLFILPILNFIESYTFKNANHINLVSEGFRKYFEKYPNPKYSYFTNGIDKEFINMNMYHRQRKDQFIITYAGNIGEGQGLHKIIPQAAKMLGSKYKFIVIGDGGTKKNLEDEIAVLGLENVELISPVNRNDLKKYYNESDFLFLHLNDFKAFEKVLPSKVFEYGAYDKPIIAGVGGYANKFIRENLSNTILFKPTDAAELVKNLNNYEYKSEKRVGFIDSYSRTTISGEMAAMICSYLPGR